VVEEEKMRLRFGRTIVVVGLMLSFAGAVLGADSVPTDIQQPGTQPQEIGNLESPDKCDNCHGDYNLAVEPSHNWRGSMMANAGRDPIFWATLAIAEQDFDGAGDLCIRCHSTAGWLAGRSTPTDGSGLAATDGDGVECDFCHKMTDPEDLEYVGEQFPPFVENDGGTPPAGYLGSGMASMWGGGEKLGPYVDAEARHQFLQSGFHRSIDFCGTCHDVSNPVVGDLAHNHGAQDSADPVIAGAILHGPVEGKAAFNNFPYQYGIVERTFSEYKSGLAPKTRVRDYPSLPEDLQAGAYKAAYESATAGGGDGDYADGAPRYFSCQTCHMRPVDGVGCNKKGVPSRPDLPLHDMTGGNYWMPDAIQYLDGLGLLRLGGGLSDVQIAALDDGKLRAQKQLSEAVGLSVSGNTVRVVNLTGHKLISGYPEGRRMWLNVKWFDVDGGLLREDGAYGDLTVIVDGIQTVVRTITDLHDPNTTIYEAHYGMTREWAAQLASIAPAYSDIPLSYDRITGEPDYYLGELAGAAAGTTHETFHFVLNNAVLKDNRIPPYGMDYELARQRNALPVPADQYGGAPGGTFDYWDEVELVPPGPEAAYAEIAMLYQPTSWEYIQFLYLANNRENAFLADEGVNMLNAWLATGMAEPYVMASTTWGQAPQPPEPEVEIASLTTWRIGKRGTEIETDLFRARDTVTFRAQVDDELGGPVSGAQVFLEVVDPIGGIETTLQGFSDESGLAELKWKTSRNQAIGVYTATVIEVIRSGYVFDPSAGQISTTITIE
jgi:hypothetical protein